MALSDLNTPPWLLEMVRALDPRGIGLDPCSNATSMVKARTAFTVVDNGLVQPWRGHGLVFCNPPHSMSPHNIEPWMEKAHREFHLEVGERDDQLVGLVPGKPDTEWFHAHVVPMRMKCFIRGRIKYWQDGRELPGPGKFPSMLFYQGGKPDLFAAVFGRLGWIPADAQTFRFCD